MKRNSFFIFILILALASCNNYNKTEHGLRYRFLSRGNTLLLPTKGQYVQFYYTVTNSDDSIIISNFGRTPVRVLIGDYTHNGGDLMEALSIMTPNDSADFLINADSFFLKTRKENVLPSYIKRGSDLKFTIKMDRYLTAIEKDSLVNTERIMRYENEIKNINNFCSRKNLAMKLDTSNGLRYHFYQQNNNDSAKKIIDGSIVTFHFTGQLLDGTEFYNSYTLGSAQTVKVLQNNLLQPPGMYNMLLKMREGEKALFVVPFDIGFGALGIDGMIPPFSTLIYEINILKVQ